MNPLEDGHLVYLCLLEFEKKKKKQEFVCGPLDFILVTIFHCMPAAIGNVCRKFDFQHFLLHLHTEEKIWNARWAHTWKQPISQLHACLAKKPAGRHPACRSLQLMWTKQPHETEAREAEKGADSECHKGPLSENTACSKQFLEFVKWLPFF